MGDDEVVLVTAPFVVEDEVVPSPFVVEDEVETAPFVVEDEVETAPFVVQDEVVTAPFVVEDEVVTAPFVVEDGVVTAPCVVEDEVLTAPLVIVDDVLTAPFVGEVEEVSSVVCGDFVDGCNGVLLFGASVDIERDVVGEGAADVVTCVELVVHWEVVCISVVGVIVVVLISKQL